MQRLFCNKKVRTDNLDSPCFPDTSIFSHYFLPAFITWSEATIMLLGLSVIPNICAAWCAAWYAAASKLRIQLQGKEEQQLIYNTANTACSNRPCTSKNGCDTFTRQKWESTFGWSDPGFFSPQHPVDRLALIGSENRNESFVLDVIGLLLAPSLVQMSDIIVQFLDILPLQVCVTFLLLSLYNFYMENTAEQLNFSRRDPGVFFILIIILILLHMVFK